jgi:hypothetical protein
MLKFQPTLKESTGSETLLLLGLWACLDYVDVFANNTSFHILWAAKLLLKEKPNCTKALTKLLTENRVNCQWLLAVVYSQMDNLPISRTCTKYQKLLAEIRKCQCPHLAIKLPRG